MNIDGYYRSAAEKRYGTPRPTLWRRLLCGLFGHPRWIPCNPRFMGLERGPLQISAAPESVVDLECARCGELVKNAALAESWGRMEYRVNGREVTRTEYERWLYTGKTKEGAA